MTARQIQRKVSVQEGADEEQRWPLLRTDGSMLSAAEQGYWILISIGSVTPNLMLVLCVSMGLMRGRKSGLWTGFLSGLPGGSVFRIHIWILCFDLYVHRLSERICPQNLL